MNKVSKYCRDCDELRQHFDETDGETTSYCEFFETSFDELNNCRTDYELGTGVNYYELDECVGHTKEPFDETEV